MNKEHEDRWLEDLLGTPDIDEVLNEVARAALREAKARNLSLTFLGSKLRWADVTPDMEAELVADIKAELVLFLQENQSVIKAHIEETTADPEQSDGADNIPERVKTIRFRFISRWAGNTRRLDADQYRYLYKRFRGVLYASDQFITRAPGGRYTEYALDENSMPIPEMAAEDLKKIPYPDGWAGTYDEANKKKNILTLAEYFRRNVCDMYDGTPVWIKVRDVLNWLSAHISFQQVEKTGVDDEESAVMNGVAEERRAPDEALPEKTLQDYATLFYERMSEEERFVFFEKIYVERTLEDIAGRMGLKTSSGASYHYKKVEDKLRYFLRDLNGLTPEDMDDEASRIFFTALEKILKKNHPTPLSINKE